MHTGYFIICNIYIYIYTYTHTYTYMQQAELHEGVSKSSWTYHQDWKWQVGQLAATAYHSIRVVCISLMSLAAITVWIASQEVFVIVYFTCTPHLLMAIWRNNALAWSFISDLEGKLNQKFRKQNLGLFFYPAFAESDASQFRHQDHVDALFWLSRYCSSGVCSSRPSG